jgi:hypothetical protein
MIFPFSIFSIRAAGGFLQSHTNLSAVHYLLAESVSIFICERVSTKADAGISFIRVRRGRAPYKSDLKFSPALQKT